MAQDLSTPPPPAPPPIEGYVDQVDWSSMRGWAYSKETPDRPLWLEVVIDDGEPVPFLSNMHRPDLVAAGFGDGRFAFSLRFPTPLDPKVEHSIVVRLRDGGTLLPNTPYLLKRAPMSAEQSRAEFEAAIAAEIEAAAHGPELDQTMAFLLQQVDRLLQGRAETQSGAKAMQAFRLRWSDYLEGERAIPLQPDSRPWVLLIDTELPDQGGALTAVLALQALGYRVAVTASRSLATTGAVAASLAAMEVTVHGAPEHFTVEDVLRRHRGQFRAVMLRGPSVAAAYGAITRMHQPRTRIIACLGDPPNDLSDGVLNLGAALFSDLVVTETETSAAMLKGQLPGRAFQVIAPDADAQTVAAALAASGLPMHRVRAPAPAAQPVPEQAPEPPQAAAPASPADPASLARKPRSSPRKPRDPA